MSEGEGCPKDRTDSPEVTLCPWSFEEDDGFGIGERLGPETCQRGLLCYRLNQVGSQARVWDPRIR